METEGLKYLAAGICMGLGAIGPAIGQGIIGGKAMEAMGRNPQVGDTVFTRMIVSFAICESNSIYALVISLVILFV